MTSSRLSVDFWLVILFGSASWLGTNAVWMELSLLTATAPEQWQLPSALSLIVQIACVGPLFYGVFRACSIRLRASSDRAIILAVLSLSLICCLGFAAFFDITLQFGSKSYSAALYVFMFGLALANATSNVLFIPYMYRLHSHLLNAYFVGMGLSSLVPSLFSLIQGAGRYDCEQSTPVYKSARFGITTFALLVAAWNSLTIVAFLALGWRKARANSKDRRQEEEARENSPLRSGACTSGSVENQKTEEGSPTTSSLPSQKTYLYLLALMALVNAEMNGIIPSVYSYAALPYSSETYHYGLALSKLVDPVAALTPMVWELKGTLPLSIITALATIFTAAITWLAALSPTPPLHSDSFWGPFLAISLAIGASSLHAYLRTVFAGVLREGAGGERRLFWCGVFIQIGSLLGSVVMFPLVNVAAVFQSATPCKS